MLPFILMSQRDLAQSIAGRVRALRLEREWTQQELAARAGLTLATYRQFERTGRISLERLLKLAVTLDAQDGVAQLFAAGPASSLAEMERLGDQRARQRGRRHRAPA